MYKLCLLLVAAFALGAQAGETEKLVGAKNADIGEFPYQVSLRLNGKHFCGGALVGKKHVVTAAHCVMATKKVFFAVVTAVVGTNSLASGGKTYKVAGKSIQPDYRDLRMPDWMYDIGVLTLQTEVELTDLIGLVKLPTEDAEVGSEAVVSGWGSKISPYTPVSKVLQKLTLSIISYAKCQAMLPSFAKAHISHICTYIKKGAGTCSGDSGGPLVQDGTLIGVVSGGIPCAKGFPDVFTNVYKYLDYVKEAIGEESEEEIEEESEEEGEQ